MTGNWNFNQTLILDDNVDEDEAMRTQLLSDRTTKIISEVLLLGVSPAIGVIGVTFNIFSIIVLLKHGIHKSSNILLISLAVTDITYLVGYSSVPTLLYTMQGGGRFLYSEPVSHLLFVLYFVCIVMDYGAGLTAMTIPMIITLERSIAVFMPLKFGRIVTPMRTWIVVGGTFIFWVGTIAYTCFWYKFEYVFDDKLNRSVGIISKSELFYKDLEHIPLVFEEIFFSLKAPPLITIIGCVAIIVRVKMASRKRSKMTSSSKSDSTSKTTQTLLAVCAAYLFICAIVSVPGYLPEHLSSYAVTTDNPTNMAVVIYMVMKTMYSLNSSWNFLVYVGLNKNFRDTFKEIMTQKCCKNKK